MRNQRRFLLLILVMVGLVFAQSAQSYHVLVRPEEAIVEPGTGMKFEAQVFSEAGVPVSTNQEFKWVVVPFELGTITDDGFFIAGKKPGRGEIIATTLINGRRYAGTANVIVGTPQEPEIKIIIRPEKARVEPGDTLRFVALAKGPGGVYLRWNSIKWMVQPHNIGKINRHGLFTAHERLGAGRIIAFVEIQNQVYEGHAKVVVAPEPSSAIAGVVTNELGENLENARVDVHRIGGIPWHRKALTDENGEYLVDKLIPGYYVIRADAQDYVPEYYDDVRYLNEATPVQVAEEDTVEGIGFSLNEGGSIIGLVLADEDGQPLAGSHIKAFLMVNPNRKFHALTEDVGTYKLGAIPTGTYVVHANCAGYKGEYFDDVKERGDASPVRVEEPNVTSDIDFGLETGSAITGIVTDKTDDSPIAGAVVSVVTLLNDHSFHRPPRFLHITRTNEDGTYTIQVKPGFYLVHAIARGYSHEWYEDAETPETGTPVQVFEDQHTTGIDLDLMPLGAIAGTVVDEETGEPLIGAHVKAFPEGHRHISKRVLTDSLGNYLIENLPAGNYIVKAGAETYLPEFWEEAEKVEDATIITVENAATIEDIDFTLSLGGVVAGIVLSEDDNSPVSGAVIKIRSVDSRMIYVGKSGDDGTFMITGIRTGSYIAVAKARGYVPEWYDNVPTINQAIEFEVAAGDTTPDIDFSLQKFELFGGSITGLVTDDSTGMPLDGALVLAIHIGTGRISRGISAPEGDYTICGLIPGLYIVVSWAQGYIGEFYNNAHRWWQADPVLVLLNQEVTGIDFALTPLEEGAYMISGNIVTQSGEPLEGALIVAENEAGVVATDLSAEDGSYAFYDLPAGSYKLFASSVGLTDSYHGGASESSAATLSVGNGVNASEVQLTAGAETTEIEGIDGALPAEFSLAQNFPNPFNPNTEIRFELPANADVTLKVYNLLGEKVVTLVNGTHEVGRHTVVWNSLDQQGMQLASGLYIYRLEAQASDGQRFIQTRRMLLLK